MKKQLLIAPKFFQLSGTELDIQTACLRGFRDAELVQLQSDDCWQCRQLHPFPPLLLLLVQTVVDVAQGKELSVVVHITVSKTVIQDLLQ